MGQIDKNFRTEQQLVDENIAFLEGLRAEDVEYTPNSLKIIANNTKVASRHILQSIRKTDIDTLYYATFPKDQSVVRFGETLFRWQTMYLNPQGKRLTRIEDILNEPIIDRIVQIISPKDQSDSLTQ